MIDHRSLLGEASHVLDKLQTRGVAKEQSAELEAWVRKRSDAIRTTEALRQRLNVETQDVQRLRGVDERAFADARDQLKSLKQSIKDAERHQARVEHALSELLLTIPNVPDASVPIGVDASSNRVERAVGSPRTFDFAPQPHWELGEHLKILDFEQASKLSGPRFVVYRGWGARLESALIRLMLDTARENGYLEIIPPLLVREESMLAAGQYPKFKGESFETRDGEYALIPTSEVPLINLHRDEIIEDDNLPIRYTAYTPCFRREAGAAGRDTRGLIRLHQFNKVELVALTRPEDSAEELERLTKHAEAVLQKLELAYRVVTLSSGDMGFAAAKTHDLEVWLPGQEAFREISSCSNCTDFQARRAKIRYRPKGGKPTLLHTLNGSGVAVGRAFVAVLENYQQADGSLRVPKVLKPYLGEQDVIEAES